MLLLDPGLGLAILPMFIGTVYLTRFVSAGSIVGGVAAVVLAIAMQRDVWMVVMCFGLLLMIVFKHRDNIQRLQVGTERRLENKGKTQTVGPTGPVGGEPDTNGPVKP